MSNGPQRGRRWPIVALVVVLVLAAASFGTWRLMESEDPASSDDELGNIPDDPDATSTTTTVPPQEQAAPVPGSGFATPGLLTFRGSPTRSYYGEGPVPEDPELLWDYPADGEAMCGESSVGEETREWCGTGWTGQPAVFDRDGRTWVVFGAYDYNVHFVDSASGDDIIPPFPTDDIIKGSVSVDPDGFPLVYSGSRDNKLRVIAFDGSQPRELWSLDATDVSPTRWNDDWDGSPLIVGDYLYEGGENSQFHVVKLNRSYAEDGSVQVDPELVFNAPSWDDELTGALGERPNDVSIENSVAYHDGIVYFTNSGGLVQGWDVSGLEQGVEPTRVFRFWTGDDTDATVVIDDEGFLYVASEVDRGGTRAEEIGQLMKLDPHNADDPLVWSMPESSGFWATPAVYGDLVIAAADSGKQYGVDRASGEVRWSFELPGPTWQSPVVVDDVWVQGDNSGTLHGYDVSDPATKPDELWNVDLGGNVESTPALWHGRLYVGTRDGLFHAIGDA